MRERLSALPTPKNDYEILVPELQVDEEEEIETSNIVEDQADVDARKLVEMEEKSL